MTLVKCRECGSTVSTYAATCPKCATSSPAEPRCPESAAEDRALRTPSTTPSPPDRIHATRTSESDRGNPETRRAGALRRAILWLSAVVAAGAIFWLGRLQGERGADPELSSASIPQRSVAGGGRSRTSGTGIVVDSIAGPLAFRAPSFDCADAKHEVEHIVCRDSVLAVMDLVVDSLFRIRMPHGVERERFRESQRQWLRARDRCLTADCVREAYNARIRALINTPPGNGNAAR